MILTFTTLEVNKCIIDAVPFQLLVCDGWHRGTFVPDYDEGQFNDDDYVMIETLAGTRLAKIVHLTHDGSFVVEVILKWNEKLSIGEPRETIIQHENILCLMCENDNV
jgi:hypothetical protein